MELEASVQSKDRARRRCGLGDNAIYLASAATPYARQLPTGIEQPAARRCRVQVRFTRRAKLAGYDSQFEPCRQRLYHCLHSELCRYVTARPAGRLFIYCFSGDTSRVTPHGP